MKILPVSGLKTNPVQQNECITFGISKPPKKSPKNLTKKPKSSSRKIPKLKPEERAVIADAILSAIKQICGDSKGKSKIAF